MVFGNGFYSLSRFKSNKSKCWPALPGAWFRRMPAPMRSPCNTGDTYHVFFLHTSTFQLLDKPWSQVSSLLPPGSCLQFLSRIEFSNLAARRFFIVTNSRSRAFRKSICAQEKVPTNPRIYKSMHSGGFELAKLTYTRLEDNLIRHRGDRIL